MKILEKRPLALILCIMLGGFSFFIDFDWKIKLIFAVVSLLLIGIIFIFDNLKCCRKTIVIISIISLSLSFLLGMIWSLTFYPSSVTDTEVNITAKVYEVDNSRSDTTVLVCKTKQINGIRDHHTVIAYVDKTVADAVQTYDVITFSAYVSDLAEQDDGFDGRSYYLSKGYSALLKSIQSIEIQENKIDKLDSFFKTLQRKISSTLKLRTNYETGSFLAALLVGDRSTLSGNIKLNFARLGISHILALSGMHLAILSLAINSVLIKLGFGKKPRSAILICLIIFYMALTGFTPSVVRSGLMLMIASLLFLLSSKTDPITSLFIAVTIIVIANPTSVYDLSLWLSAFATLGVIAFSEVGKKADKYDSNLLKLWISFKNGCLVSVFAFCATFAFCALRFNGFSVISVFTTLLFSFLIQFFIYGGLLLILIGSIIPFGKVLILFSDLILYIAELISSIKFVYVSMNSFIVRLLIVLLSVFFFSFLLLEIKNKRRGIIIIVILMLSVFICAEIHTVSTAYDDEMIYVPGTSGDIFILKSGAETNIVYSGKAFTDNSWDILDTLSDESLTYVDNFVICSYSYWTIDFATTIIDKVKTECIMLPNPQTAEEINTAEGLSDLLSEYGTSLAFYEMLEYVDLGEYEFRAFNKVDYDYGKYPENVFEIICGEERYTYLSVCEYDNLPASAKALIFNSENLIIGSIGNTNYYLFEMRLPNVTAIYTFDEGRLTDEALEYYNKKGVSVNYTKTPLSLIN